jgi:fluoride exporter
MAGLHPGQANAVTALLVAVGGAVGAVLRHLVDVGLAARFGRRFPLGTLVVNVAGSLVLGLVTGAAPSPPLAALLGTGFCGALTTYSTFAAQTLRLLRAGHPFLALLTVTANLVLGMTAFTLAAWALAP